MGYYSSRAWVRLIITISNHYICSSKDHSLFLHHNSTYITILIYVDDIIIARNHAEEIQRVTTLPHSTFRIKNLDDLMYFHGPEVAHNSSGIHLCQHKYILSLLHGIGMLDNSPVPTPTVPKYTSATIPQPLNDASSTSYRRLIGKLIYLTTMRPDIIFTAHHLSQFLSTPTNLHQQATHHMLQYPKGSPGS